MQVPRNYLRRGVSLEVIFEEDDSIEVTFDPANRSTKDKLLEDQGGYKSRFFYENVKYEGSAGTLPRAADAVKQELLRIERSRRRKQRQEAIQEWQKLSQQHRNRSLSCDTLTDLDVGDDCLSKERWEEDANEWFSESSANCHVETTSYLISRKSILRSNGEDSSEDNANVNEESKYAEYANISNPATPELKPPTLEDGRHWNLSKAVEILSQSSKNNLKESKPQNPPEQDTNDEHIYEEVEFDKDHTSVTNTDLMERTLSKNCEIKRGKAHLKAEKSLGKMTGMRIQETLSLNREYWIRVGEVETEDEIRRAWKAITSSNQQNLDKLSDYTEPGSDTYENLEDLYKNIGHSHSSQTTSAFEKGVGDGSINRNGDVSRLTEHQMSKPAKHANNNVKNGSLTTEYDTAWKTAGASETDAESGQAAHEDPFTSKVSEIRHRFENLPPNPPRTNGPFQFSYIFDHVSAYPSSKILRYDRDRVDSPAPAFRNVVSRQKRETTPSTASTLRISSPKSVYNECLRAMFHDFDDYDHSTSDSRSLSSSNTSNEYSSTGVLLRKPKVAKGFNIQRALSEKPSYFHIKVGDKFTEFGSKFENRKNSIKNGRQFNSFNALTYSYVEAKHNPSNRGLVTTLRWKRETVDRSDAGSESSETSDDSGVNRDIATSGRDITPGHASLPANTLKRDTRTRYTNSAGPFAHDPSIKWIDPSVLRRIRAFGSTVIYFGPRSGGAEAQNQSESPTPVHHQATPEIVEEIAGSSSACLSDKLRGSPTSENTFFEPDEAEIEANSIIYNFTGKMALPLVVDG